MKYRQPELSSDWIERWFVLTYTALTGYHNHKVRITLFNTKCY